MKSVYELKRFKNSKHPDLVDALKLYAEYTEPAFRTDTKEIMHCLDMWNTTFEDSFYVVGLYLNNILIGFSELAYFVKEKFVIVDYVVIDKKFRGNHTFFVFIDEVKNFLSSQNLEYNYIVAEVGCYNEKAEPPESSKFLIRLLKVAHFGVVKCNYYVPRVGIYDYESQMRAIMMIYSLNDQKQIKRETFFQIVKAIYYKYYQRWHNLFVDDQEKLQYDREIQDLIKKMEEQLSKKSMIEINGLSGLFPVMIHPEKELKSKRLLKLLTGIVLFIISVALVGFIYSILKSRLGWDSDTATTILMGGLGLTLFLMAWFFENRSNLFSKAFEKLLDKF